MLIIYRAIYQPSIYPQKAQLYSNLTHLHVLHTFRPLSPTAPRTHPPPLRQHFQTTVSSESDPRHNHGGADRRDPHLHQAVSHSPNPPSLPKPHRRRRQWSQRSCACLWSDTWTSGAAFLADWDRACEPQSSAQKTRRRNSAVPRPRACAVSVAAGSLCPCRESLWQSTRSIRIDGLRLDLGRCRRRKIHGTRGSLSCQGVSMTIR